MPTDSNLNLPRDLPAHWRLQAAELRRYAAIPQATTLETCADDLDAALRRDGDELLTLGEAASESGYSADHLGRQVARGALANAGRRNAPRIRRADLPRKPGTLSRPAVKHHIGRDAIARAVIDRHVGEAQ